MPSCLSRWRAPFCAAIAPLNTIFRALRDNGFRGYLSLELFNQDYYKKPAEENAKTGIDKVRAAVRKALA